MRFGQHGDISVLWIFVLQCCQQKGKVNQKVKSSVTRFISLAMKESQVKGLGHKNETYNNIQPSLYETIRNNQQYHPIPLSMLSTTDECHSETTQN